MLRDAGLIDSGLLQSSPDLRSGLSRLLPEARSAEADDAGRTAAVSDARGQFAAIREALCRVGATVPIVAAIEDAHWADLATLDCLQFLAERIGHARILLLVSYRPDELHRRHPLALTLSRIRPSPSVWRLTLGPLADREMQALQHSALAGHRALSAQTLRDIRGLAEGNPLFAEELLRHAAEHGGSDHELPLTVRATVLERLVQLDDEQRDVLVRAAVFGRRFEGAVLAQTIARPLETIGRALRRARDLQLIVEDGTDRDRYAFRHALMREALYGELSAAERQPLHRRIALQLEGRETGGAQLADLAYHWWAAREPLKALEYSERAGDAAMDLLAYKDAALHFERALEYATAGRHGAELAAKRGTALGLAGHPHRARAALESAVAYYESAGDAATTADLCRQVGWLAWLVSDNARALAWFERSRDIAHTMPDDSGAYAALVNLAMFHVSCGDAASAWTYLAAAEAFTGTPQAGDVSVFYDARAQAHSLDGRISCLIADSRRGIDAAQRAGDVRRTINGYINLARAAAYGGMIDIARDSCEAALRLARQGFVTQREFLALVNRAFVELLAGEYAAARATVAEAIETAGDLDPALVSTRLGDFAIPLGLRLRDAELVKRFAREETLELAFRSGATIRIAPLSAAFIELSVTNGELAAARALLRRALVAVSSAEAAPSLMLLAAAHGEPDDVRLARDLLARWAEPPDNRAGRAHLALFDAYGATRSGAGDRRCAQAAAQAFNVLRLPYYEALALELDRKPERALAIYRKIGDARDVARLERELVNRRGRTREQLTQRERDIAQLVAQGKSNAEIATYLVLSGRTVENHVSAILHKLSLRSRTELALHVRETRTAVASSNPAG